MIMEFVFVYFTVLLVTFTSSMSVPKISISFLGTALLPCQKASVNNTVAQWLRRNEGSNSKGSTYTTLTDGLSVYHDRMTLHSENYDLEITNVTETDSGVYRCVIESESGIESIDLTLIVKDEDLSSDTSTVVDVLNDVTYSTEKVKPWKSDEDLSSDTSTVVDVLNDMTNSTEKVKPLKSGISIVHVVIVPLAVGVVIIISGSAAVLYTRKHILCVPRHQFSENIRATAQFDRVNVSGSSGEQDTVSGQYQPLTEKWQNNPNTYADIARKDTAEGFQMQSDDEVIPHIYDECGKPCSQQNVYQSLIKGKEDAANIYD